MPAPRMPAPRMPTLRMPAARRPGRRLPYGLLCLALLVPVVPAAPAGAAPAVTAPGVAPVPAAAAASAPVVPCPVYVAPRPSGAPPPRPRPTTRPPLPPPPARDADRPPVGGPDLGADGLVLPAGAPPLPGRITATAWVVADLDSGSVLAACDPHGYRAPASTLKVLTALTALPRLDKRQVTTITDADLAIEPGSSAVGLVRGGRYTVDTLLRGMLLASGNDAANVLARLVGGRAGVAGGVAAMNAEARRLQALDTTAVTPSGLDGPGQWTSAYDLALIARAAFARPDFSAYTATRSATIPAQPPKYPRPFQVQNENRLLTGYPGALGGKTGYTTFARHTYVGAAARGGRRLVVTMLAGESRPVRLWKQAATLLDWGFRLSATMPPVGRLVDPDDPPPERTAGAPSPASPAPSARAPGTAGAPAPAASPGATEAATGSRSLQLVAAGAVLGVLAAAVLVLALLRGRRDGRPRTGRAGR